MLDHGADALVLECLFALVLSGLSTVGIWDPWELDAADAARRLLEGSSEAIARNGPWLASLGFRAFGMSEWGGRLPIALCGIATIALTFGMLAWLADRSAARAGAVIAATSPLFLFNTRLMVGEAAVFAAQGLVGLAGLLALSDRTPRRARIGWLAMTLCATALAIVARGALLGALPPLLAVAAIALSDGRARRHGLAAGVLIALSGTLTALVLRDVLHDPAEHSLWLGGGAIGGNPPSFDTVIERGFHAFAPWSALLVPALASALWHAPQTPAQASDAREQDARWLEQVLLVWIALGYAAQTLYLSRYGREAVFAPVVALSGMCALYLRRLRDAREAQWALAIASTFLTLLLLRDFVLYPSGPVHGLAVSSFKVPEVFNPKREWGVLLGGFAAATLFGLGTPAGLRLDLRAPYRFVRDTFRKSRGHKAWLIGALLILLAVVAYGVLAWLKSAGVRIEGLRLSTQGTKWGKRLLFLPVALPLAIALVQLVLYGCSRLAHRRSWLVLIAGAAVGLYTAVGFMPQLSAHFSPRDVYETYNAVAKPGETLVEYRIGGRAAAYYAKGSLLEVDTIGALTRELERDERRFAVIPRDDLAIIDRSFRRKSDKHLFVVDGRSARVLLVSNQAIKGRKDDNPLRGSVLSKAKSPKHPVNARFEDKIELLGYDIDLPHGEHVGAGESFEITWHFRVLRSSIGEQRLFVHIDGEGQRIHGDHDPVQGVYPVKLWEEGDIIVDKHRLEVPSTYRPATFTIFMGFYSGDTRLTVKEGPRDDENRVRAGALRIR
jgi:hypothetical protein